MDRIGISAALGVPEVWRYDGESLRVLELQADGRSLERDRSPGLPFLPLDEVVRFLDDYPTTEETSWARGFRARVRAEIAPRLPGEGADRGH